jgi:transcriptional regulator with XRE-family HTH domain
MARKPLPRFEDWEAEKLQDPAFIAAAESLEPGYQVARLRMQHGLTQAQLAELIGTRQPSIARLENGASAPSLSFLNKIAAALDAKIEVRFVEVADKALIYLKSTDV